MSAPILVAGLDSRSLLLEAPVLLRDQAVLAVRDTGTDGPTGVSPTAASSRKWFRYTSPVTL